MKSGNLFFITIMIIVGICAVSCEKEERTTLTSTEKKLVDSIYSKQISYVRKSADKVCDSMTEVYFNLYVDSLKEAYINSIGEIEEYLRGGEYE